jgi:hypothetical protein
VIYEKILEGTRLISKYSDFKEKDIGILRFILKHGIVTSNQIMTYIGETSIHNVYRRLRKLETAGLIWKKKLALTLNVYFPKRDARDFLDYPVTVANDTSFYTAQHDLIINDLILHLKATTKVNPDDFDYRTEREYRYELLEDTEGREAMIKKWNQIRDTIPDVVLFLPGYVTPLKLNSTRNPQRGFKRKFSGTRMRSKTESIRTCGITFQKILLETLSIAVSSMLAKNGTTLASRRLTRAGHDVFQQIKVRPLPAEVKGAD